MAVSEASQRDYGTCEELKCVFEDALKLVRDRERIYGARWKNEPVADILGNVNRKSDGLRHMFKNDGLDEPEFGENCLDVINYAAFCYRRWKETH